MEFNISFLLKQAQISKWAYVFLKKSAIEYQKYFRNLTLLLGFGGIGQMGVLLAKKMGNHVTVISSSNKKEALAKEIGADNYVVSKDPESMSANAGSLNLIIDTIPAAHDINPYLSLLKKKGTMNIIGAFPEPFQVRIG